jgi:hypothetical protein
MAEHQGNILYEVQLLPSHSERRCVSDQTQYIDLVKSSFLYTTTCFGCPDQPSSGICQIHKNKYKEREAFLYIVVNYNSMIPRTV